MLFFYFRLKQKLLFIAFYSFTKAIFLLQLSYIHYSLRRHPWVDKEQIIKDFYFFCKRFYVHF
jgi:hypothetical protein